MTDSPTTPKIDPRFIYLVTRKNKKTMKFETAPALNADGHIDYAFQLGMGDVLTEIVDLQTTQDPDGGTTRWVTVKATVTIGDRTCTGMSSANSRRVSEPGFEVAVAETRAIKRAIAVCCNITEKLINPDGATPSRDMVDLPLDQPEPEPEIPQHIRKPMSEVIDADGGQQFDV